jgi:hypothetical protein
MYRCPELGSVPVNQVSGTKAARQEVSQPAAPPLEQIEELCCLRPPAPEESPSLCFFADIESSSRALGLETKAILCRCNAALPLVAGENALQLDDNLGLVAAVLLYGHLRS